MMMMLSLTFLFSPVWYSAESKQKHTALYKCQDAYRYTLDNTLNRSCKLFHPPEMTDSFQPSRSVGRPEVLEKHWSSRTFSLFSSASFLGQSEPPPPTQPPTKDKVCWFSELHERESRPSEHHRRGGEPCSHPSWTLKLNKRV